MESARRVVAQSATVSGDGKAKLALTEPAMPAGSATQQFTRLQNGAATQNNSDAFANGNAVLNSFRLEQKGDQVRIIDADGSMYSGFVQNASGENGGWAKSFPQPPMTNSLKQQVTNEVKLLDATKAGNVESTGGQNYFFRVTGMNRSLNQSVLFSGTLAADAKAEGGAQFNFKQAEGNAAAAPQVNKALLPLSQTQVRGRALIGGSNVIEVNAAPTPP
jgi:hypothetical protein